MMAPNPSSGNDISRTHSVNKSDRDLRDLDSIDAIDIETGKSIPWPVRRPSAELTRSDHIKIWTQLTIFAVALLAGGCTYSLLSPFYTKEATAKGLSVSQTGVVYGSVFITTIIFSPIFGKFINSIGSRNLFLYGTFLAGSTTALFGFLEFVNGSTAFFVLSLSIRVVSAIGESAFFCAIYPLATSAAPDKYRSTVLSIMETMFGLGLMIGPFIGSVLYELDGFYLPFVSSGAALAACPLVAMFFIGGSTGLEPPFLEQSLNLSTVAIGAMFTVEGATYAAFSPFWGWLLDKWVSPWVALVIGTVCVIVGYCFVGPAPFLPFISENVYLVGFSLCLMGFGVAATFITTLTFMLSESVKNGAPDNEQTRGMITSLWFISENLGGYIGASLGGLTFDKIGFENGSIVIIGIQLIALIAIPIMWKLNKPVSVKANLLSGTAADEKTKLLTDLNSNNDVKVNYKSLE